MQQLDQDLQYSGSAPGIRGANEETRALWGGDVPGQGGTCPLVEPTGGSLRRRQEGSRPMDAITTPMSLWCSAQSLVENWSSNRGRLLQD